MPGYICGVFGIGGLQLIIIGVLLAAAAFVFVFLMQRPVLR